MAVEFEIGDTVKIYDVTVGYDKNSGEVLRGDIKTFIFNKKYSGYYTEYLIGIYFKNKSTVSGFKMRTTRMVLIEKTWKNLK